LPVASVSNTTVASFNISITRIYLCEGEYLKASGLLPTGVIQPTVLVKPGLHSDKSYCNLALNIPVQKVSPIVF